MKCIKISLQWLLSDTEQYDLFSFDMKCYSLHHDTKPYTQQLSVKIRILTWRHASQNLLLRKIVISQKLKYPKSSTDVKRFPSAGKSSLHTLSVQSPHILLIHLKFCQLNRCSQNLWSSKLSCPHEKKQTYPKPVESSPHLYTFLFEIHSNYGPQLYRQLRIRYRNGFRESTLPIT
jgi:hypothetical protein